MDNLKVKQLTSERTHSENSVKLCDNSSKITKSRFGRSCKPKIQDDFYCLNHIKDYPVKKAFNKNVTRSRSWSPQKKLESNNQKLPSAHVTGDSDLFLSINGFLNHNSGHKKTRSKLNRSVDYHKGIDLDSINPFEYGLRDDNVQTKINNNRNKHGEDSNVNETSRIAVNGLQFVDYSKNMTKNIKSTSRTYSNRKKSASKESSIENWALPKPIFPLSGKSAIKNTKTCLGNSEIFSKKAVIESNWKNIQVLNKISNKLNKTSNSPREISKMRNESEEVDFNMPRRKVGSNSDKSVDNIKNEFKKPINCQNKEQLYVDLNNLNKPVLESLNKNENLHQISENNSTNIKFNKKYSAKSSTSPLKIRKSPRFSNSILLNTEKEISTSRNKLQSITSPILKTEPKGTRPANIILPEKRNMRKQYNEKSPDKRSTKKLPSPKKLSTEITTKNYVENDLQEIREKSLHFNEANNICANELNGSHCETQIGSGKKIQGNQEDNQLLNDISFSKNDTTPEKDVSFKKRTKTEKSCPKILRRSTMALRLSRDVVNNGITEDISSSTLKKSKHNVSHTCEEIKGKISKKKVLNLKHLNNCYKEDKSNKFIETESEQENMHNENCKKIQENEGIDDIIKQLETFAENSEKVQDFSKLGSKNNNLLFSNTKDSLGIKTVYSTTYDKSFKKKKELKDDVEVNHDISTNNLDKMKLISNKSPSLKNLENESMEETFQSPDLLTSTLIEENADSNINFNLDDVQSEPKKLKVDSLKEIEMFLLSPEKNDCKVKTKLSKQFNKGTMQKRRYKDTIELIVDDIQTIKSEIGTSKKKMKKNASKTIRSSKLNVNSTEKKTKMYEKETKKSLEELNGLNLLNKPTIMLGFDEIKCEPIDTSEDECNEFGEDKKSVFKIGDLVWSKIGSYPYWPSMICTEPITDKIKKNVVKKKTVQKFYHVRFFGDQGRRSWINAHKIIPYESKDDLEILYQRYKSQPTYKYNFKTHQNFKVNRHLLTKWKIAVDEIDELKTKSISKRQKFFKKIFENLQKEIDIKKQLKKIKLEDEGTISVKSPVMVLKNSSSPEASKIHDTEDKKLTNKKQSLKKKTFSSNIASEVSDSDTTSFSKSSRLSSIPQTMEEQRKLHNKNNLFKGVTRQKLCNVCEKYDGSIMKCTGQCMGLYHSQCTIKIKLLNSELTTNKAKNKISKKTSIERKMEIKIEEQNEFEKHLNWNNLDLFNIKIKKENENESEVDIKIENREKKRKFLHFEETEDEIVKRRKICFDEKDHQKVNEITSLKTDDVIFVPNEVIKIEIDEDSSDPALLLQRIINAEINNDDNRVEIISICSDSSDREYFLSTSMEKSCRNMSGVELLDRIMPEISNKNTENDCLPSFVESNQEKEKSDQKKSKVDLNQIFNSTNSNFNLKDKHETNNFNDKYSFCYNTELRNSKDLTQFNNNQSELDLNKFKCFHCRKDENPPCFVCGLETSPKNISMRVKCSLHQCGKFYHKDCLKIWPQTRWSFTKFVMNDEQPDCLVCPVHVCHTCVSDNPRASISRRNSNKIARCLRCPATYHTSNFCIPAGTIIHSSTQIVCPRHADTSRHNRQTINTTWCFICSQGGNLICCETCPTSVHPECVKINFMDDGTFVCEDCESGRFPLYDEIVWVKLGSFRWWPAVILFPNEISDNVNNQSHQEGDFVVKFFGTYNHYWVNRGRVFLFQEEDEQSRTNSKRRLDRLFNKAIDEALASHRLKKDFRSQNDTISKNSLRPPHYVKIKTNKPYGNVKLCDGNTSNITACECDPAEPFPCGPDTDCINRLLLTECNPSICPAGNRCCNQRFEKRLYPPVEPCKTKERGWGLRSVDPIKMGEFITEYVGEVIDENEYQRRIARMHKTKVENYYFLTIDKDRIIDAGLKGNVSRFMNHSCQPNCETQKWTVNGDTRVGLFALDDIPSNTELTFNYNLECIGKEKKLCQCGAKICSGYIGVKLKTENSKTKRRSYSILKKKAAVTPNPIISNDVCFVCGQIGDVRGCSYKDCIRCYHLKCVSLECWPQKDRWICPSHNCNICGKRTIRCCHSCTNSYCPSHAQGNVRHDKLLGFVCFTHDQTNSSLKEPIEEYSQAEKSENGANGTTESNITGTSDIKGEIATNIFNQTDTEQTNSSGADKTGNSNFSKPSPGGDSLFIETKNASVNLKGKAIKIEKKKKRSNKILK